MSVLYGVAIGNTPKHLKVVKTDTVRFPRAEMQFEMWRARRDGVGRDLIAGGEAPARWLHEQGVDVWAYIYLQFTSADLGESSRPPSDNQYYFRREVKQKADEEDWYCRCKNGSISDHFYGRMMPLALDNAAYRAWAVKRVLEELEHAGTRQLRFDVAFLQPESYIYCPITCGDEAFNRGLFAIWDALRAADVKLIANGAWEMQNPDATPEEWIYPAMAHLDGVMAEVPHGGKHAAGGWWNLTDERLAHVARAWMDAGKAFIISATYNPKAGDDERFGSFDAFAHHYYDLAERLGCLVAINHRLESGNHTPWLDWYPDEPRKPIFPLTPADDLRSAVVAAAQEGFCLRVNPMAALAKRAWKDGYQLSGNEKRKFVKGIEYVSVYADSRTGVHEPRAYYCPVGNWDAVSFFDIAADKEAEGD